MTSTAGLVTVLMLRSQQERERSRAAALAASNADSVETTAVAAPSEIHGDVSASIGKDGVLLVAFNKKSPAASSAATTVAVLGRTYGGRKFSTIHSFDKEQTLPTVPGVDSTVCSTTLANFQNAVRGLNPAAPLVDQLESVVNNIRKKGSECNITKDDIDKIVASGHPANRTNSTAAPPKNDNSEEKNKRREVIEMLLIQS